MNPQELRIGNLVECFEGIFKIKEIHQHFVVLDSGTIANYSAISSVGSTEERLLKLGFKQHTVKPFYYLEICNDWTRIYYNPLHKVCELSISGHSAVMRHVESVHQLQNLFYSLCGEELTVNPIEK